MKIEQDYQEKLNIIEIWIFNNTIQKGIEMLYTIATTDKNYILKKLKEIQMDKKENREGPDNEMSKIASREEKFDGTDTAYYDTIYDKGELKNLDQVKNINPQPSSDAPAITAGE